MVFNEFYKESTKITRRLWMLAGLIILFVISGLLAIIFLHKDESPEAVERTLEISPGLRRVNQLCNDLPKPEGLQFVAKKFGGNAITYAIEFNYKKRRSSKEINDFYLQWFIANGWSSEEKDTLRFRKGKQRISISNEAFSTTDFSIYCAEIFREN